MRRTRASLRLLALVPAAVLACAFVARADDAPPATAEATAASQAQVAAQARLAQSLDARAAAAKAADVATSSRRMLDAAQQVDATAGASADAGAQVASRLAREFQLDATALVTEQQALDVSWGNLVIAHTLAANATGVADASVENLVALHADGMGWGRIAAGLGLKVASASAAVSAESRVAAGQLVADGRVPHIAATATARIGGPDAAAADASAGAAQGAAGAAVSGAASAASAAAHVDAGLHLGVVGGK